MKQMMENGTYIIAGAGEISRNPDQQFNLNTNFT